jgi:1-aminocyclopropane-1-carboxylate deaminase/D-cysteine desulfhydrase-like pyridoxal-dependent ACC family enzyme
MKRDDLTTFGSSGVKARKLEGFLAHAIERRVSEIVIPLGNVTNLGPDLARAAGMVGIKVKLLIVDDPPLPASQRNEVFASLRSSTTLLGKSYGYAGAHLVYRAARNCLSGTKSIVVAPSPAHPAAIIGAAKGYIEAMRQSLDVGGALPGVVYIASAAGCTAAGFALAEALLRRAGAPPVRIVAVQVTSLPLFVWLPWLVRWTAAKFDLGRQDTKMMQVLKVPRHAKYGSFDDEHKQVCRRVLDQFGIQIDPIYGGKSWSVMEAEESRVDRETSMGPPLFWHCGYTENWKLWNQQSDPRQR